MFAEKHYPEVLTPEDLDAYLARGWYRMGQTIFSTHFLCFGEQFYSAVWIRLNTKGYTFRKSLRKLIKRNQGLFRTEFRKAFLNEEKEALFQRYRASFPGMLAPTLKDSLLDGEDYNIYNTYEVAIYDGDKLVAFSFFDIGRESIASIMGVYEPDYHKYSLGFYTMLMEIQFCIDQDIPLFYPGYVVPGYSRFDYKARIGEVTYFDLYTEKWLPYKSLKPTDIPITKMENKLKSLHQLLKGSEVPCKHLYYPLFEANLFGFWRAPYFDFPTLLWCFPKANHPYFYIIVYDIRVEAFQLLKCSPFDDLQFYFNEAYTNTFDRNSYFLDLIVIDDYILVSSEEETIADYLVNKFSSPSKKHL